MLVDIKMRCTYKMECVFNKRIIVAVYSQNRVKNAMKMIALMRIRKGNILRGRQFSHFLSLS